MKRLVLAIVLLLAIPALLTPAATAIPPVCIVKEAGAVGAEVEVWVTCGPRVIATVCPKVGPCGTFDTDTLP